jgi:hypothetical protein
MTMPAPNRPPGDEDSSANGWDLLDDYQVGKDVVSADAAGTRRITASLPPQPPPVELPPPPQSVPTTRTLAKLAFWRGDGSAAADAEIMSRILAGRRERDDEAQAALDRVRSQDELDRRERIRQRQAREIAEHLAMEASRRRPAEDETPLQKALREAADMFLALGVCPDHLEWLPDAGRFCSWGGKLYDHSQLFALKDARGNPLYTCGPSPHGANTACYSPRERRWRLHQAVPPEEHLTPVERLLPVPRRHDDGAMRFSARRPGTVLMAEGEMPLYVVRNAVYTASHLIAAHHLHSGTSPLFERLAERAEAVGERASALAKGSAQAVDGAAAGLGERVIEVVGRATDSMSDVISKTTRFFRRR